MSRIFIALCITLFSTFAHAECIPVPKLDKGSWLENISTINLYVFTSPQDYQFAVNCFGVRNLCASQEVEKETLDKLKIDYEAYSPALHDDKIAKIFAEKIENAYQRFVTPDKDCNRPKVRILKREDRAAEGSKEGALTFVLRVEIADYTKPRVAVLFLDQYRSNMQRPFAPEGYTDFIRVIPLDLPDNKIEEQVNEFASQAIKEIHILHGMP